MFFIWIIIFQIPDSKFHLIACDVGQGDAILAVYKNYQILTDGGPPNGKVEKCLSDYLPFWDREIEVVVNTHPQLDHFGGLIKVFKNYKVDNFVASDLPISTQDYQALLKEVGSQGTHVTRPYGGVSIGGSLMHYDIFYPTEQVVEEVKNDPKRDTNDVSVQALVKFGEFTALMTGDIGSNMAEEVLKNFPKQTVKYIKIPHHGSKYGLTADYLKLIDPKLAVISVGKNNYYGHPTSEILNLLKEKNIKILRTDEIGSIEIVSNGKQFWVEN